MAPLLGHDESSLSTGLGSRKNILYVDAYDSFSYNVVAMLEEVLSVKVTVMMIDSQWPDGNMAEYLQRFEAVVLGPGPGDPNVPADIGIMNDIWNLRDADILPVLGICLGFQSLCLHHGLSIGRLPYPLHGQVRQIATTQEDIFTDCQDVEVTLYHSLYAKWDGSPSNDGIEEKKPSSADLKFLAWLFVEGDDSRSRTQIPMATRHKSKPFWGVQFHPESCKSDRQVCSRLLKRWWEMALSHNKQNGRRVYGTLSGNIVQPSSGIASLPDIASTMLNWSASTSEHAAFRTLPAGKLDAEMICEKLNAPDSPTVLFQSNDRFSVISVPSPSSWRLEFYTQTEKLMLEQLPDPSCPRRSSEQKGAVVERKLPVTQLWDLLRYLMEMKKVRLGDRTVPFWGGFLGYFSYELGLACLARPKNHDLERDHTGQTDFSGEDPADVSLLWTERSIVFDKETSQITIQSTRKDDEVPTGWLDETLQMLRDSSPVETSATSAAVTDESEFLDSILRQAVIQYPNQHIYQDKVDACKAELEAGESYELCLSCETSVKLPALSTESGRAVFPWKLYKRLRRYNPAAFSGYARLGRARIVSSSPECFLNWDRTSTLEMKPMKGTVRKSEEMTLEKAKEILGSTKEMAENLMIADLIRHDLYGICGSGGVRVEKLLEVEDHGRVYQMITHVKGTVDPSRPGFTVRDKPQIQSSNMSVHGLTTLQRCLPPGSMTGAPKERSCMHLSSIENRKRGIYSGVMGFLDLGGGGSFSVLIRTAFTCADDQSDEQRWRIGAGGAVTVLSSAQGEWDEMLTKLRTVCGIFAPLHPSHLPLRTQAAPMAGNHDASMEEILWRSPPHVQMMGGYLHSNNILFYFAESPFFDPTSNNASLAIQANYNEALRHFVETRDAFEARLKTMQGLEFVVAYDPLQAAAQSDTQFAHEPSNVWVIRKQTRQKRAGLEDDVVILSTYFVMGDCIYMAPSVASVVGNRILSSVTSLTSLLKTASTLPTFTPSHGHTYLPPVPKSTDPGVPSQQSKENTPLPEADPNKNPLVGGQASNASSGLQDTITLAESFALLSQFGDEFMDESPLVGEPGSFILSKSGDADRLGAPKPSSNISRPSSVPGRAVTPQVKVDTPGKLPDKATMGATGSEESGKLRKKKTKAGS
ncbi:para-aminobenzoate synthase [Aspergillus steynii IBT 23096]|uniref:Mediator of RNA polymerase II transcription subunit 6 n=1 Tax=Aspergillus steynii IBT 23096 TaxID=1392250 RepID=A0A2I2G9E1_9EURO|nr:para-aminobenzoate synthase [Aspergillus steynii IBT 23096]PLB49496.1 para-aminobenzoate synthase [Aspergillus steynii IBT 23096]